MQYKHFSIEEREKIQTGLWHKRSLRGIAKELGRSAASISREVRRNLPQIRRVYTPRLANERALEKRKSRGRKDRLKSPEIRKYVVEKLKEGYSPEQAAGTLPKGSISHEAIYQFIYAQIRRGGDGALRKGCEDLRPWLKRRHKRRVRKGFRNTQKLPRLGGLSIRERPSVVQKRKRIGDWEGDSLVSRKSPVRLNSLVDRKSGLLLLSLVRDGTAAETAAAVSRRLRALPTSSRKTLTLDNGAENAEHARIEAETGLAVYFANPYHSWERGTNENTNGLVRWYFPKGTDFALVSEAEVAEVERALNARPRKRHRWKSPIEVFTNGVALRG